MAFGLDYGGTGVVLLEFPLKIVTVVKGRSTRVTEVYSSYLPVYQEKFSMI